MLTSIINERLAGSSAKLPELEVRDTTNSQIHGVRCTQPAIFSTCLSPKIVSRRRIPARHVNPVSHVSDRHFILGPVRKEWSKQIPAHLPMQAAHAIDRPASTDRQIGHIETFR